MSQPSKGTVILDPLTGSCTFNAIVNEYTDAGSFDTFEWNATDENFNVYGPYTFKLSITSSPDAPQIFSSKNGSTPSNAATINYTNANGVYENTVQVATISVSDPDIGESVQVPAISGTDEGKFDLVADGSDWTLVFNSAPDYEGLSDTQFNIDLVATDTVDAILTSTQSFVIDLLDAAEAPVIGGAPSSALVMSEDGLPTAWPELTLEAVDEDAGATFTWSVKSNPSNGTLTGAAGNGSSITPVYTPNLDYSGTDQFTIQVFDGSYTDEVVVNVTINAVAGDIPDFNSRKSQDPTNESHWMNGTLAITHPENTTTVETFSVTNPDNSADSFSVSFDPGATSYPLFTLNNNGVLSFSDPPDYETDSLSHQVVIKATDAEGNANTLTIDITLSDQQEAPVIAEGATYNATINEDSNWSVSAGDITASDEDSGQSSSLIWRTKSGAANYPQYGTLSPDSGTLSTGINLEGLTYFPNADYDGSDSFVIEVVDSDGVTDEITISITIDPVADDPRIYQVDSNQTITDGVPYRVTLTENNPATLSIYANEVDGEGINEIVFGDSSKDEEFFDLNYTVSGTDPVVATLSFKSGMKPDFEIAADEGENGVYEVFVEVYDNNVPSDKDTLEILIEIGNENESPSFASSVDFNASVLENQTLASQLSATDPDLGGANFNWEIIGGDDMTLFELNSTTGDLVNLLFKNAPNFENPSDTGPNNVYEVTVKVYDDSPSNASRKGKSQAFYITVGDDNDAPILTPPSTIFITEPLTYVDDMNLSAYVTDEDNDPISWVEAGGDVSDFFLDPTTGLLKFENVSDADSGPIDFSIEANASDGRGGSSTATFTLQVREVAEAPAFPFTGTFKRDIQEDTPTQFLFSDTNVSDPETGSADLDWDIVNDPNATKGSLVLASSYFTYTPASNVYGDSDFTLRVSDSGGLYQDLNVTIFVQPVNDPPTIEYNATKYPIFDVGIVEVFESTEDNKTLEVMQLEAADSNDFDDNPIGTQWELVGKEGNATHKDFELFFIDDSGKISFLNYPDFEEANSTAGNKEFEFQVKLTDKEGQTTPKEVMVRLRDVPEAPEKLDATLEKLILYTTELTLDDNVSESITIDMTKYFKDPEGLELSYSLADDNTADKGTLTSYADGYIFSPIDDFYTDANFTVRVTDATGRSSDLAVLVYVSSVNDLPTIEYNATLYPNFGSGLIEVFESNTDAKVIQLQANDAKDNDLYPTTVTWELQGKDGNSTHSDFEKFTITQDGLINFVNFPDYETISTEGGGDEFEFRISLTDKDGGVRTQEAKVKLKGVDEPPVVNLSSNYLTASVQEDQNVTIDLKSYVTDPEGDPLRWQMVDDSNDYYNETDSSLGLTTGILNYYPNQDYSGPDYIDFNASDLEGNWVLLKVLITVSEVNDLPSFRWPSDLSASERDLVTTNENQVDTIIDLNATDVEDGDTQQRFTWSLAGKDGNATHKDYELFKIDSDGKLTFATAPDYENDQSVAGDGGVGYEIRVVVKDSDNDPTYHELIVKVLDVEEDPYIENYQKNLIVTMAEDSVGIPWQDPNLRAYDDDDDDTVFWYQFNESETLGDANIDKSSGNLSYNPPVHFNGTDFIHLGISNDNTDPGIGNYEQNMTVVITISPVNDKPVIYAPDVSFDIMHGKTTVGSFQANDSNQSLVGDKLGYDSPGTPFANLTWDFVSSGTDYTKFEIENNGTYANLSFIEPAVYDSTSNNEYTFSFTVSDESETSDAVDVTVKVSSLEDEAPVFDNPSGFTSISVFENSSIIEHEFNATDPEGDTLYYRIVDNNDTDFDRFVINDETKPILSFNLPLPNYEQPEDLDGGNDYEVIIEVRDRQDMSVAKSTQAAVKIIVGDENEAPSLNADVVATLRSLTVNENTRHVVELISDDEDGGVAMPEILYTVQNSGFGTLTNLGDGSFSPSTGSMPDASDAFLTVVGDVDRDGDEDFVGIEKTSSTISLFLNGEAGKPLGSFDMQEITSRTGSPEHAILRDVVGTDHLDLIVAYYVTDEIVLFEGQEESGGNFFQTAQIIADEVKGATFIDVSDVDQDDDLDLMVLSEDEDSIQLIRNGGENLGFDPLVAPELVFQDSTMISKPRYLSFGDYDKDGDEDFTLASVDGNFSLFISQGDGKFTGPEKLLPTVEEDRGIGVFVKFADLDNDTDLDLITSSRFSSTRTTNKIQILYLDDDTLEYSSPAVDLVLDSYASSIIHLDLGGDPSPELLVAMPGSDRILQYDNNGKDAGFTTGNNLLNNTVSINHLNLIEANQIKDPLTYAIIGGIDEDRFKFDGKYSGKLLFKNAPDYENPLDTARFNQYEVIVGVFDDSNLTDQETLVVSVEDVREAPYIIDSSGVASGAASATYYHPEHIFPVIDFNASNEGSLPDNKEADDQTVSFEIVGGEDSEFFDLNKNTGELRFKDEYEPDFDIATDSNGDKNYSIILRVTDSLGDYIEQNVTIALLDANDKPTINVNPGDPDLSVDGMSYTIRLFEDQQNFFFDLNSSDFNATDPEDSSITWSMVSGYGPTKGDANVNGTRLEYSPSQDYFGPDQLLLRVTDENQISTDLTLNLEISPVNDYPVIQSPLDLNFTENNDSVIIILSGNDVDSSELTWSVKEPFTEGKPDTDKVVVVNGNELKFALGAKDFENPQSYDGDNTYEFTLLLSDGNLTTEGNFTLHITNVNDFDPVILNLDSNQTETMEVMENSREVIMVNATDGDADDNVSLVYEIVDYGDDWKAFVMNSATGLLSFRTAPDFEGRAVPRSSDGDNNYIVRVSVSDGDNNDTRDIIVKVLNANEEAPVFGATNSSFLDPKEHPENQALVMEFNATDDLNATVRYEITGGSDASSFEINATTRSLNFASGKIPDFEIPSDDDQGRNYEVYVTAFDEDNKSSQLQVFLIITDIDEVPILKNVPLEYLTFSISEDEFLSEDLVNNVEDPEGEPLSWEMIDDAIDNFDETRSSFDLNTGLLKYTANPDFSGVDYFDVNVSDPAGNSVLLKMQITVSEVNDPPKFRWPSGRDAADFSSLDQEENRLVTLTDFNATDVEDGEDQEKFIWSLAGKDGNATHPDYDLFKIDKDGKLTFTTAPDYEDDLSAAGSTGPGYEMRVVVEDSDGNSTYHDFAVKVLDVDEAPTLKIDPSVDPPLPTTEDEPLEIDLRVYVEDPEGKALSWEMIDDEFVYIDQNSTSIDQITGMLNYHPKQDFHGPDNFDINVSDPAGNAVLLTLQVTVNSENDPPLFSWSDGRSNSDFNIIERSEVTQKEDQVKVLFDFNASDVEDGEEQEKFSWALSGKDGNATHRDHKLFRIDENMGILSFVTAHDDLHPIYYHEKEGFVVARGEPSNGWTLSPEAGYSSPDSGISTPGDIYTSPGGTFASPSDTYASPGDANSSPSDFHAGSAVENLVLVNASTGERVTAEMIAAGDTDWILLDPAKYPDHEDDLSAAGSDGPGYEMKVVVKDSENNETTHDLTVRFMNEDEDPILMVSEFNATEDEDLQVDFGFTDPDNSLEIPQPTVTKDGSKGRLIDQNGTFYYQPNPNEHGTDKLEITLEFMDRNLTFEVEFEIEPINDAPTAVDDSYIYEADNPSSGDLAVLINDTDPENIYSLRVERVFVGDLRGSIAESNVNLPKYPLQFTPETGFIGDTSFEYKVSDGDKNDTHAAKVEIRVATSKELPGWRYVGEFGYYYQPNPDQNWILHDQLDWLYVPELEMLSDATWIWSEELGWFWSGNGNNNFTYPYLYSNDLKLWVFLQEIGDNADWVLDVPGQNQRLTRMQYQVERIKESIESLQSALSVSEYIQESIIFSDEEKRVIVRELLFTGGSATLATYGIELSF